LTSGSSARAASAAVLMLVTPAPWSTVPVSTMMNHIVTCDATMPPALSARISRSDLLAGRPASSSTSCEVCQKNMYGLMVVPMTPVMT